MQNAPRARTNCPSRHPRRSTANRIAAERTSAPSCVNTSASRAADTAAVPRQLVGDPKQRASVGQNTACAIHISVGKPYTRGQRNTVDKHAYMKIVRLDVQSTQNVRASPSSGAEKNKIPYTAIPASALWLIATTASDGG